MTTGTGAIQYDQGGMIAAKSNAGVTGGTAAAYGIGGIMMDSASGIGGWGMARITAGTGILQHANGGAVRTGTTGVIAMIRIHMAEGTIVTMDIDHQIGVDRRIMTGGNPATALRCRRPNKSGSCVATVGSRALLVPVTGQTTGGVGIGTNHILHSLCRVARVARGPCGIMASGTGPETMKQIDVIP